MRTTIPATPAHALAVGITVWLMSCAVDVALAQTARRIIDATGIQGGLIVHVGCGNGRLTAALHASDSYVIQGLDADARNVKDARQHLQSLNLYARFRSDIGNRTVCHTSTTLST